MRVLLLIALFALFSFSSAEHWAVLVAGSSGFENYRHQADICHAYHTLLSKGLKAKNIIVFSYDDVANDPRNPFPGKLFNKPTNALPGNDVNSGCVIDYKGDTVTPANFLNVLKGDAAKMKGIGSGRVLKSTSADRVFLNFADHGGSGILGFPKGLLFANDLIAAFTYMHTHKMYSELVFYLEACESGSIFHSLPMNTRIYATSAANADESSYSTYCPPDDQVYGKSVGSCLGDLYSVNWMEDTDKENVCKETLEQQFQRVRKETTASHVLEWGDLRLKNEPSGDFTGGCDAGEKTDFDTFLKKEEANEPKQAYHSIDSRDVKLFYLQNVYQTNPTQENLIALQKEELSRKYFDLKMYHLASINGFGFLYESNIIFNSPKVMNYDCLKAAVSEFQEHCGKLSDYALKHVKTLAHMCSYQNSIDNVKMIQSIQTVCEAPLF